MRLNIKTLKDCGIYEPKTRQIAVQDWVKPEYIRRHVAHGNRRGGSLGLVIFRMLAADPAPLSEEEKRTQYYRKMYRQSGVLTGAEDDEEEEA